jgi:hypothetical protein
MGYRRVSLNLKSKPRWCNVAQNVNTRYLQVFGPTMNRQLVRMEATFVDVNQKFVNGYFTDDRKGRYVGFEVVDDDGKLFDRCYCLTQFFGEGMTRIKTGTPICLYGTLYTNEYVDLDATIDEIFSKNDWKVIRRLDSRYPYFILVGAIDLNPAQSE